MNKLIIILSALLFSGCLSKQKEEYNFLSYLDIGVDSTGNLPANPYILEYTKGNKQLVAIGTVHSSDTASPAFAEIEELFYRFSPDVILNEGGNLTQRYSDRNTAIRKAGELGLIKYLADKTESDIHNGDIGFKSEFEAISDIHSKEEALLFFVSERFVFPFLSGQYGDNIDSSYRKNFIEDYCIKNGINLTDEEQTFNYYKSLYRHYFKTNFNLQEINYENFSPLSNRHSFCAISRTSKELRDKYLTEQIEAKLNEYNKVMVVFGGWHILAIEPALEQIVMK